MIPFSIGVMGRENRLWVRGLKLILESIISCLTDKFPEGEREKENETNRAKRFFVTPIFSFEKSHKAHAGFCQP